MEKLETDRLILRSFEMSDLEDFFGYASIEGVGVMAGWPKHEDIEFSEKILKQFVEVDDTYAIVEKGSNKVIGSVGVHRRLNDENYDSEEQREIGYVLSKDYWGKGLMTEAVTEVIRYIIEETDIKVIYCKHADYNAQSARVIEKCEFELVGNTVIDAPLLDKKFEGKVYRIVVGDWVDE